MARKKKIKPIKRQINFDMNLPVMEERSPQRHLAKSILREALVAEAIKSMGVKPGETSVVRNLVEGRDYPEIILSQDERGYIVRPKLSEPATFKSGGNLKQQAAIAISKKERGEVPKAKKGMKFNPKYTRGSADVGKRKKLMAEISAIYKKHRGTKAKRKKKGFPPAVAARLKRLMAQRDKI
tara:strand:+ start:258 stop:803 length:546 start_codon:yes stop_codon:yes gene_type:complete